MTRLRYHRAGDNGAADKRAGDKGVVTAMFAVLAVFFFLIIALVGEGGRKLSNLSRAEDIAAEAARSAAATLDIDTIATGIATVDEARAREEADKIVAVVDGATIERFDASDDSILVSVRVSGNSYIPGFDIDGVGSHRASVFDPFG